MQIMHIAGDLEIGLRACFSIPLTIPIFGTKYSKSWNRRGDGEQIQTLFPYRWFGHL